MAVWSHACLRLIVSLWVARCTSNGDLRSESRWRVRVCSKAEGDKGDEGNEGMRVTRTKGDTATVKSRVRNSRCHRSGGQWTTPTFCIAIAIVRMSGPVKEEVKLAASREARMHEMK
ncbi:hypothetical protein N7448_010636 [Penicillium atrosanguineum]|uniref:Secreted protein n=1 Tax=Penicillium atrosanguineum TaxID=1132637 RepID=A0A9W9GHS6_9EURO|nr:uncharacterized protein N7443_007858 [Penicillium atrosanguineum]KAJ5118928.1 hypothetical protein N7526_010565 [Penicillium atrosanguineum]KAJ5119967.1 hypothetical protein N7448_010636 [Penicillium atrosanguineum]KAJ5296965.1 hypothetical protein N7443_007858 [Penicillium atrosanguineum]KAJ5299726.1 hypothetical protein N7476_011283 [Penicillium atrosanguineum]